jgi:hypothetical protein
LQKKRARLDLLRVAVEKGQSLDPVLIDKLLAHEGDPSRPPGERASIGLRIGGILVLAFAVGLVVIGLCIANIESVDGAALPGMLGAAGLFACMGIGLFIASRMVSSKARSG